MPTYEYVCVDCANRVEVSQSFSDDPLEMCVACGGKLRKVFFPVGIQLKGGGFYSSERRAAQPGRRDAKADKVGEKADAKSDGKAESKTDSKAAASSSSDGSSKKVSEKTTQKSST
jgi:putative FmdB family regulatory protein